MKTAAYEEARVPGTLTAERSGSTPSTAKRFRSMAFMFPRECRLCFLRSFLRSLDPPRDRAADPGSRRQGGSRRAEDHRRLPGAGLRRRETEGPLPRGPPRHVLTQSP